MMDQILIKKPEMTRVELLELIKEKQSKIGAGYLTEQGALFLVAADLGASFDEVRTTRRSGGSVSVPNSEVLDKLQKLERDLSQTREDIAGDLIDQLHKKIFQTEIDEITNYVKNQPEYQELSLFKPLVELSSLAGSDLRWWLAAAIMSLLEWYLKTWLTRNSVNSLQSLRNNNINELISKIESTLVFKKVDVKHLILSDIAGKRHFRNKRSSFCVHISVGLYTDFSFLFSCFKFWITSGFGLCFGSVFG